MKKKYLKPEILVDEFISEIYMQVTSQIIDPDSSGKPRANDRRGSWGDLWYSEPPTN